MSSPEHAECEHFEERNSKFQEQWEFPHVVLEDWEKEQLVIEVIKIAIKTFFSKHYYSFGGKMYLQEKGDP